MQIMIIAGGSRGDVQPYVALGVGLQAAGHTVRILAPMNFRELITAHGLEFFAMNDLTEAMTQERVRELAEQGNLLKMLATTGRGAQQLAHQAAVAGLTAAAGADLLIGGLGGLSVGVALAEKLGAPFIQAYLMPFTPTRAFPSVLTPLPQSRLTGWANSLSHRLARQMMWQMLRQADNQARAQVLNLPPAPFWGPFDALRAQGLPVLYGYSPRVVPPPDDWGAAIHVTGYWFLPPPTGWTPPPALVDFLAAGPPPVYIGFGSMPSRDPRATARLVLDALARTGQRGILASGWGGLETDDLPRTVHRVGALPHAWLFPQMAAVVHHGGAGTTGAGLAAGVPSILTPFFGDQPFWGRRVHTLGVGPAPIPRRRLTAEKLATAIQQAVSDEAMRRRAASLGERIRADRGIEHAVAVITARTYAG